ncbi:hypothetical protein [Streptomyces sp. NBC_00038]|uniref:hypothetical protein n=1 Tax=Streptomyces sp. NBC_00038 TaxID=2903615 RepID=UPI00225940B9|nr:hypothetical protein [Streptomyces sp. NBC_00038]MCX5558374.1 hypothetical protein [Streptomyces sp. NBC_00038]
MADMVSALTGIGGALLGTAVGAFVTHFLQRRNASLARLHEERISAYVAFAEAVMEFRRELMDRWFVERDGAVHDSTPVYSARSTMWTAYYRVVLLAGDEDIRQSATTARETVSSIKKAGNMDTMKERSDLTREAVRRFVDRARTEVSR